MAIAKGRTNSKAERDLVLQGFDEQLKILVDSKTEQENLFKARLYDIVTDNSLSDEEKSTRGLLLSNQLQELEERHIRIRRSVFIGLYSFWEISLMDIADTHMPTIVKVAKESKKSRNLGASEYLKLIYSDIMSASVCLIDNNIREFRNYMVHGSLTEQRESLINALVNTHPEFCIKTCGIDYFIDDYKGLFELLSWFITELNNAESKILGITNE